VLTTSARANLLLARALHLVFGHQGRLRIGQRGLSEPDVGHLVRQSEHLRGFRVGTVDEHDRGEVIGQSELGPNHHL
jgi:hypothetical protein